MKSKKRILITGGAGFIGSNLANYYLNKNCLVTIFDNLYRHGVEENLKWLAKSYNAGNLKVIKADILDQKKLEKAIKGQEIIFHMAGQTAVTTSINKPRLDFEFNALGTFNVLEAARLSSPNAIIITASTNKVYGNLERLNVKQGKTRYFVRGSRGINEKESLDFYSPYGCSKGVGDQYTRDYHRIYGLKTIVFRQSCIYGMHQFGVEDQGWLAHFALQALKRKKITIFGNGKQVRDVLYIDDLMDAFDRAIKNILKTSGEIYNIGGGINNTISLLELIGLLEKFIGKKVKISFTKERLGDQKIYISDIRKAKNDFGWTPKMNVKEGVEILFNWLKKNK